MTNDGWSKKWPILKDPQKMFSFNTKAEMPLDGEKLLPKTPWISPVKLLSQKEITTIQYTKQGSNLVDDQAYLYFQCEKCQALFDPKTRSFATLNQKRFDAGWKCIWNLDGMGYKVYCKECGE